MLLKASNSPSSKQQPRDALILRFPPCVTSTESRKLEPRPRKSPGMSLVCFRKPGSRKVGLRAGSRQRQLLIGHDMGLTVALTNGNKELPRGPAHRSKSLLPCPCPPRPQSLLCEALLWEKGRRVGRPRETEAAWITRGWWGGGGRGLPHSCHQLSLCCPSLVHSQLS